MLDRATIDTLCQTPEKNAPPLNVALAEEGASAALLALARSPAVGPEALCVIASRAAGGEDDEELAPHVEALERLLIAHPHTPAEVRDRVLERRATEPFFVLAAASHPHATRTALERAVDWPAASAAHDRRWLSLLVVAEASPDLMRTWACERSVLRREGAARLGQDAALLATLARDPARRVRRALAGNGAAISLRDQLAAEDPAPDVRTRAAGPLSVHGELAVSGMVRVDDARFAAALRSMQTGGTLAPDTLRALSAEPAALDDEGALLAGMVLPQNELGTLLDSVMALGTNAPQGASLAAGIALRPSSAEGEAEHAAVVHRSVKSLRCTTTAESRLTGKARLAAWAAEGLAESRVVDRAGLLADLERRPLAADRMILARALSRSPELLQCLLGAVSTVESLPGALLELAWAAQEVPDAQVLELSTRVAPPKKRAEDLLEDEVDLDPSLRSLPVLEKVVLATATRADLSPRASLAAMALDARRVRYVLSAMPPWKGRLSGGRLSRVLRRNAGAITVAQAESRARGARVEEWTDRLLTELEMAVALAVGHLTGAEVARRIEVGRQHVEDGINLASGAEVRAALEGPASVRPILAWATKHRTVQPAALSVWLLLEKLDRERAPTLVASSVDSLASGTSGKGAVLEGVCEALALLERRHPGRLEAIHPQSPRGRATMASATARAYRALGGLREV